MTGRDDVKREEEETIAASEENVEGKAVICQNDCSEATEEAAAGPATNSCKLLINLAGNMDGISPKPEVHGQSVSTSGMS